jgi:DMSO/TMAO reductase YedYZ molybdopterin-dependent catalytic subunit
MSKVSRRGFLVAVTGAAVAAAAGCANRSYIAPTPYVPGSKSTLPPPTTPTPAPTLNAANAGKPDPNYGKAIYDKIFTTDTSKLYITQYDYSNTPAIDASQWSMKIDGLVESPLTLDYKTIQGFPAYEEMRTLECIGNPVGGDLIGNILWHGFHFQEILDRVKVKPEAKFVKFEAADGYTTGVALDWITQPNVMMAYMMNGMPLTQKHGFPVRILMPGLYGQKNPRWLTHIEFIDSDYRGFWETHGWSNIAAVQTNSIIMSPPADGDPMQVGSLVVIQGVAFAGKRKITKVEVQINDGAWMPAELAQGDSPLIWTAWHLTWTPPAPGDYTIGVRATDDTGFTQFHEADGVFGDAAPDGVQSIHRIKVKAA